MPQPKHLITVVIRSYKHWDVLPRAIESAKAQTGQIVENGADRYAILGVVPIEDKRTTKIFHKYGVDVIHTAQPDITGQANVGFRAADSKYVYPLDSDDFLHPNALLSLGTVAETAGADVVYGNYEKWSVNGFEALIHCSGHNQDLQYNCFIPEACLYKKETWLALGGYDESIWRYAQWDYFLRLLKAGGSIKHLPFVCFRYSMSPTQLTSRIHKGEYKAKDDPAWKRFVEKHGISQACTVGHGGSWHMEEESCPA